MKNLDLLNQKKMQAYEKLAEATKGDDMEAIAQAWKEVAEINQEALVAEFEGLVQSNDNVILQGRGVRALTSEETKYYNAVLDAMKTNNPQQALADLTVVMPKTTIDSVFEDLQADHPLLEAIDFQNTSGLIEWLTNTNTKQLASWGTLTAEIVKELSGGFKKIDLQHNKLSAFMIVAKSMLDLGPAWLDRYVRACLADALAYGLEDAIINGTGKDMPIGMIKQVNIGDSGTGVTVTDGVYPDKAIVQVKSLDPVAYGELIGGMAVDDKGNARIVQEVLMIVNPQDYLKKVMPATTIRNANGTYVNNVFPYPTKAIQSVCMASGKAVFGIAKRYFMGLGTAKEGKIEFSDEYKFLEDERTYLVKLYGHGQALDNHAFTYADISGLQPAIQEVTVKGTVSTKEVTA